MVEVWIPYGETEVCANIPTENYMGSLEPRSFPETPNLEEQLNLALENPIGVSLREAAKGKEKAVILLDEYAGSLPLKVLALRVRGELEAAGISAENIVFLFGRGLEKPYSLEEALNLLGEAAEGCRVEVHDPWAEVEMAEIGSTSRRVKVFIRRDVAEAGVKILVGKVSPHPYAGFSGYGQTLMSAAGSLRTLTRNYVLYGSLDARAGKLEGNPLHAELTEEARLAGLSFALHVVCDWDGKPLKIYAGDPEESFRRAASFFEENFSAKVKGKPRVVVASPGGKPYDSTLDGALQTLERVYGLVGGGGIIVLAAECFGERLNPQFLLWLNEAKSVEKAEAVFREKLEYGFHKVLRLRKLQADRRIYMVTGLPETLASLLGFRVGRALDDVLQLAFRGLGEGKVLVVPQALKVLPRLEG